MRRLLTTMILAVVASAGAVAQWVQTAGPEGGFVMGLTWHPRGPVAILSDRSLYRLDGARWDRLGMMEAERIDAVGDVLIASSFIGLQRSTDMGTTWSMATPSPTARVVGIDGQTVFASDATSIYRSVDSGVTWSHITDLGPNILSVATHDSTVLASSEGEPGLVRSTNGGRNWSVVSAGLPDSAGPAFFVRVGTTFYASIRNTVRFIGTHGVYQSTDDGRTWSPVNTGLAGENGRFPHIYQFYFEGDVLALASTDGLFRFRNGSWQRTSTSNSTVVAAGGPDTLYRGGWGGLDISIDAGNSWSEINQGILSMYVSRLMRSGNGLLAATPTAIFRTSDNGNSWSRTLDANAAELVTVGSTLLSRPEPSIGEQIYRSTDNGVSWTAASSGITRPLDAVWGMAASDGVAYVGMRDLRGSQSGLVWKSGGVFRTFDGGQTWSEANNGLPTQDTMPVPVEALVAHGPVVIASTIEGGFRSTDHGASWSPISLPMFVSAFNGMVHYRDAFYVAAGSSVHRSTDNGTTWMPVGSDGTINNAIAGLTVVGDALVAFEHDDNGGRRVYLMLEEKWRPLTNRLPSGVVPLTFAVAGDRVMLGTASHSVWIGSFGELAGVEDESANASLATRVFPNPVTSSASLEIELDRPMEITLTIANARGEEVYRLDGKRAQAGRTTIALPLEGLATGTYVYRVNSGGRLTGGVMVKAE